uniref:Imidazole glycerol phosphate synthase hisHF n=1 Tax=Oryza punctata TaxID=4537 RepID=A0A0E0KBG4_ORYPU
MPPPPPKGAMATTTSIHAVPCSAGRPKRRSQRPGASTLAVRASADASTVTLLDYGAGNVRSVRNAIRHLGFGIRDVRSPEDILAADRLVFPGVGAFGSAMDVLTRSGMADALREYIRRDRPFLGICLGLQLLFDSSEENGPISGLGMIPGVVRRFDSSKGLIVPHIGWNSLEITKDTQLLQGADGHHVYFVHSYHALPMKTKTGFLLYATMVSVSYHPSQWATFKRFSFTQKRVEVPPRRKASNLAKRVIACLDVRSNDSGDLVVTKGDQYDVRNLGKPVDLASQYYIDGADEISFLNITGFRDFPLGDLPMLEVLRFASEKVFVPLTVGGGIRDFTDANGRYYSSLEVASEYFRSGADKISIGSDAVFAAEAYLQTSVKTGKSSLEQISRVYGNQAVVVSIDPRRVYVKNPEEVQFKTVKVSNKGPLGEEYAWYQCTVSGGRDSRPIGAYELAKAVEELGAGEILLNCIDCDGQGCGFDIDLVKMVSDAVTIPVIASSGAGAVEHFSEVFEKTNASAALAAGIFHRKEVPILAVKEHLVDAGVEFPADQPHPESRTVLVTALWRDVCGSSTRNTATVPSSPVRCASSWRHSRGQSHPTARAGRSPSTPGRHGP